MKIGKTPPPKNSIEPRDFFALKRKLLFFQRLALGLVLVCLVLAGLMVWIKIEVQQLETPASQPFVQKSAPYSDLVEETIAKLRYSGYYNLMRKDARLRFDFEKGTWTINHIRQFGPDGQTVLERNRYGACGDLAAYTYEKIKPYFPEEKYSIDFLKVTESSYFQQEMNSDHYILRILDLTAGKVGNQYNRIYLLDPSLRRYGTTEVFDDYLFMGNIPAEKFFEVKDVNETFDVDTGPPIIINRSAYVFLYVNKVDGKFDADNFSISLSVVRRYRYARKPIFSIVRINGRTQPQKSDYPIKKVLRQKIYDKLIKRLMWLYLELEHNGLNTATAPAATQP